MKSIDYLCNTIPDWAEVTQRRAQSLHINVVTIRPSGAHGQKYALKINQTPTGKIDVSEASAGTILPKCCVERHINPDSTFCLHLDSNRRIDDDGMAINWWHSLATYLDHQAFSSKWRRWPLDAQLSHGHAAANTQLKMEAVASELGWKTEVLRGIFRKAGWLGGVLPRKSKGGTALANARHPCPRGCLELHYPLRKAACSQGECLEGCEKTHRPISRRRCPHREAIEKIVLLEHKRRSQEDAVMKTISQAKIRCCGTIDNCSLSQ